MGIYNERMSAPMYIRVMQANSFHIQLQKKINKEPDLKLGKRRLLSAKGFLRHLLFKTFNKESLNIESFQS